VNPWRAGKLPAEALQRLLAKLEITDQRVIVGPGIGEDAAVIQMGDRLLVAKTDPVTLATDLIGWYAVHVNANDIATMGARPCWFLATVLLPEQSANEQAEAIFNQIIDACQSLGVTLVGGHTEITYDFKRPVVVGCMLGEVATGSVVTTAGASVGDSIVLTKGIAVEGTAALAREAPDALLTAGLSPDIVRRAGDYLFTPGISVVNEALIAGATVAVSSMHDPTEGGLATGLAEIAAAAGVGIVVDQARIPVLAECRLICDRLGIDPWGLLASGALVITLSAAQSSRLVEVLAAAGINASVIGEVVAAEAGLKMRTAGGIQDIPGFARDELARYLEGARPDN